MLVSATLDLRANPRGSVLLRAGRGCDSIGRSGRFRCVQEWEMVSRVFRIVGVALPGVTARGFPIGYACTPRAMLWECLSAAERATLGIVADPVARLDNSLVVR